jgi:hypothetical protein
VAEAGNIRQGSPYNDMTQTRLAIIVDIKPLMEYATLCISIRWATPAIRQSRTFIYGACRGAAPSTVIQAGVTVVGPVAACQSIF